MLASCGKWDDSPDEQKRHARLCIASGVAGPKRADDMQRQNDRELREQLVKLRADHRELDEEIVTLEENGLADQLLIRRLKKKKLALRDQITSIEDQLLPDIIA